MVSGVPLTQIWTTFDILGVGISAALAQGLRMMAHAIREAFEARFGLAAYACQHAPDGRFQHFSTLSPSGFACEVFGIALVAALR